MKPTDMDDFLETCKSLLRLLPHQLSAIGEERGSMSVQAFKSMGRVRQTRIWRLIEKDMARRPSAPRGIDWSPFDEAPHDGRSILACRDNDCGWEYAVVWWCHDLTYPWKSGSDSYPEDRFDYWATLHPPEATTVDESPDHALEKE